MPGHVAVAAADLGASSGRVMLGRVGELSGELIGHLDGELSRIDIHLGAEPEDLVIRQEEAVFH